MRYDHYIGIQELLGIVLAIGTWPHIFRNVVWTAWIDNQGVLHGILKGSMNGPESNALVGSMWLYLAEQDVDLYCGRVESKANIADGPTRYDLSIIYSLQASFCSPAWPAWAGKVW